MDFPFRGFPGSVKETRSLKPGLCAWFGCCCCCGCCCCGGCCCCCGGCCCWAAGGKIWTGLGCAAPGTRASPRLWGAWAAFHCARCWSRHTLRTTNFVLELRPKRPFTGVSGPPGPRSQKTKLKKSLFEGLQKSPRKYPKKLIITPSVRGVDLAIPCGKLLFENNSDHPHPPYLQKICPPKYAIQWGSVWHKSRLKSRDFYRKYWHTTTPNFYGIRTPPLLCHMNRFYWGWGWSLICWLLGDRFLYISSAGRCCPSRQFSASGV